MVSDFTAYADGEGGAAALAADLATEVAKAQQAPVLTGEDWATYSDGRGGFVTVESPFRDRPRRVHGTVALVEPESFGEYINLYRTPQTRLYADVARSTLTAVFNDHPAAGSRAHEGNFELTGDVTLVAGYRDHTATMTLGRHPDWVAWVGRDMTQGQQRGTSGLMTQRDFGEFIEDMAHTIVSPDSATMLEVATTLTARRTINFDSRARLDNGDMAFGFVEETTARAGRAGQTIEIPTRFVIRTPIFQGGDLFEIEARLRFRPDGDGVRMGYRLLRQTDREREAFDAVVSTVSDDTGLNGLVFYGTAPQPLTR
jgi:hypothetical protein